MNKGEHEWFHGPVVRRGHPEVSRIPGCDCLVFKLCALRHPVARQDGTEHAAPQGSPAGLPSGWPARPFLGPAVTGPVPTEGE